ncbi:hypothetical protein [uncultured Mesonia sp.]|uniref:hypothetical protein n=1 Tax=uncultured Mesonia sp. TaxID=399731 RepID=UPI00374E93F7
MKSKFLFLSMAILISCGPKSKHEFFKNGYCNINGVEKFSNKIYIRNTSASKIITYTIQQTIIETGNIDTKLKEIAPGDYKYVGCDHDAQGHKKYKVVGAYYGLKKKN